jgi:hypothetical protein
MSRLTGSVGTPFPFEESLTRRVVPTAGGPSQDLVAVPAEVECFCEIGRRSRLGHLNRRPKRGRLNCQGMPLRPRRFSRPPRSDLRAGKPTPAACLPVLTPTARACRSARDVSLGAAATAGQGKDPLDACLLAHRDPQLTGCWSSAGILDRRGRWPLDTFPGPRTHPQWQTMVTTQRLNRRLGPDAVAVPTPHEDVR